MDKKYHIFISSTYSDLQEERREALQALLGMGYIVSGMEYFPAIDLDQFEYIKRQIDDCDYYLLIVAGRYGSISQSGISYTEMEYKYAVEKKIPIVALLCKDVENLPAKYTENDKLLREKLNTFRDNVCSGRIVKFWNSKEEIGKHVISAMVATTNYFPSVGWVRANRVANEDALNDIIALRKENEKLKQQLKKIEEKVSIKYDDIAPLESEFAINGEAEIYIPDTHERIKRNFSIIKSWKSIFMNIATALRVQNEFYEIKILVQKMIRDDVKKDFSTKYEDFKQLTGSIFSDEYTETIIAQLSAQGLIKSSARNGRRGYILSDIGEKKFAEQYIIRDKRKTKAVGKK